MFHYWVTADDERGYTFAHRYEVESVVEARRRHELSKEFRWMRDDLTRGWVSALYHEEDYGDVEVAPAGWQ